MRVAGYEPGAAVCRYVGEGGDGDGVAGVLWGVSFFRGGKEGREGMYGFGDTAARARLVGWVPVGCGAVFAARGGVRSGL